MKTTRRPRALLTLPGIALVLGFALSIGIITVVSADPVVTKGPIPDAAFRVNGDLDARLVPDFVPAYGRDGETIAGYIAKADILHRNIPAVSETVPVLPAMAVYGEDLVTVVGHMVPGKGYVPLGKDPRAFPDVEVEVSSE